MQNKKGQKQKWLARVKSIIDDRVKPAYRKMLTKIISLKDRAGQDAGVWRLPNGAAYYQYCLNYHTTTGLKPEEIHMIGINEVKRIQTEMILILKDLGIKETKYFYEMSPFHVAVYLK